MKITDRESLLNETISRVINNAPVSEVLRHYSVSVQEQLSRLSDEELVEALHNAGYVDILSKFTEEPLNFDEGEEGEGEP